MAKANESDVEKSINNIILVLAKNFNTTQVLMFGNLKFVLFYWHTNAENNEHLRPNVYLKKYGA